jgi:hypothetical protein
VALAAYAAATEASLAAGTVSKEIAVMAALVVAGTLNQIGNVTGTSAAAGETHEHINKLHSTNSWGQHTQGDVGSHRLLRILSALEVRDVLSLYVRLT